MRLHWTSRQLEIKEQFAEIAREHLAPRVEERQARGEFNRMAWHHVARAGLWRLPVPESLGGLGYSWWEFVAAVEGLARHGRDLGFCLSLLPIPGVVRALLIYGTDAQRKRYLPQVLAGGIASVALTESSGGSNVAGAATRAVPSDDGGFVLSGEKVHITNAPVANLFCVLGRVEGLPDRGDLTVFLVEPGPGVEAGEPEQMLGAATSPTGPVRLDGARVSHDQVLGGLGDGLAVTYRTIDLDRLLYGVVASSFLDGVLDASHERARERVSFGEPISNYQHVQRRLTDMKLAAESTRWMSYAALDHTLRATPSASLLCSAAKLTGSEGLVSAARDALQVHAHAGYTSPLIGRSIVDSLALLIAGGTSDIQRKKIFTEMELAADASPAGSAPDQITPFLELEEESA